MGMLNQLFGSASDIKIAMNSAEAFAAICLVAIASDGYLSAAEETEMNTRLSRMKLFEGMTEDQLAQMKRYLVKSIEKHGARELVKSAQAALPPNMAPTAFTAAVDLVFADGTVSREEQAFIDDLRSILSISDELALKVVEVITIKNKGLIPQA